MEGDWAKEVGVLQSCDAEWCKGGKGRGLGHGGGLGQGGGCVAKL